MEVNNRAFRQIINQISWSDPKIGPQNRPHKIKRLSLSRHFNHSHYLILDPRKLVYIDAYINLFRFYSHPVIRVYHSDPQYGPKPGTKEFEFPETTAIKPDDPKVIKTYGNAFNKTDLDKVLKAKGVNTLFLCGLSSVGCVLATYEGAMDLDYNAFMLQGALIGPEAAWTKTVLEFTRTIDYGALKLLFDTAK